MKHGRSYTLVQYRGGNIPFPWGYARKEFVHLRERGSPEDVGFTWVTPQHVRPISGAHRDLILYRTTTLASGETDFGLGGRLLKDSVLGEHLLRQLHYVDEMLDAPDLRCILAATGPWVFPDGYPDGGT